MENEKLPLPNMTMAAFLSGKPAALAELLEGVRNWTESELKAGGFTGCVTWNRCAVHATFMGNEVVQLPQGVFNFNWLNNRSRHRQPDLPGFCRHIKALCGSDGRLFEIRHAAFLKRYCKCERDRRRGWECESGAEFHSCDRTPFEASYYAYPAGPVMISGWPVQPDGSFGHRLYRLRKDAEEFGLLDKYHADGEKAHWMDDDWYLRLGRVDGVPEGVVNRVVERVRDRLAARPPVTYPVALADLRVALYRNTLLTDLVSVHTFDEIIADPGVVERLYRQVGETA
jgi:hypothetical protein